jgi:hypothetical protein
MHSRTGRADERFVAAVVEVLAAQESMSTGTRSRVLRQVQRLLAERDGEGVVPIPSRASFYRLVNAQSAFEFPPLLGGLQAPRRFQRPGVRQSLPGGFAAPGVVQQLGQPGCDLPADAGPAAGVPPPGPTTRRIGTRYHLAPLTPASAAAAGWPAAACSHWITTCGGTANPKKPDPVPLHLQDDVCKPDHVPQWQVRL